MLGRLPLAAGLGLQAHGKKKCLDWLLCPWPSQWSPLWCFYIPFVKPHCHKTWPLVVWEHLHLSPMHLLSILCKGMPYFFSFPLPESGLCEPLLATSRQSPRQIKKYRLWYFSYSTCRSNAFTFVLKRTSHNTKTKVKFILRQFKILIFLT